MNEDAKAARREYQRRWQRDNKERVKAYQAHYWERKAAEARAKDSGEDVPEE